MNDDTPHAQNGDQGPTPQRQTIRPPGAHPPSNPSSGPQTADRLTDVAHELRNMLDGSMRWLGLAAAVLPEGELNEEDAKLAAAREQIIMVHGTLERMSSMVNAALRSRTVPIGSPLLGVSDAVSLGMAIDHAVDVVRPLANERGVRIALTIEPDAGTVAAGPMYTVVLNGLINAIDSIGTAGKQDSLNPGGTVEISVAADARQEEVIVEIRDDGVGIDPRIREDSAFKHGMTTKDDGYGIGLAISRQIVESLEGVISLQQREDREGSQRRGAVLRVRIPMGHGRDSLDRKVG
ncbi:MAG: sensor histidine kinase [Phycisphaerales bacterium]